MPMHSKVECSRHDDAIRRIMDAVEIPDRVAEDLVMAVRQDKGKRSRNRREHEFKDLTGDEVAGLEHIVRDAFEELDDSADTDTEAAK